MTEFEVMVRNIATKVLQENLPMLFDNISAAPMKHASRAFGAAAVHTHMLGALCDVLVMRGIISADSLADLMQQAAAQVRFDQIDPPEISAAAAQSCADSQTAYVVARLRKQVPPPQHG